MAKFLIPSILAATILIAGAFALLPIDEAMTIHLTGGGAAAGAGTVDSAAIINGEIVSADLNVAAGIVTGQILDDTIGPEDVTGSTDGAALLRIERASTGANTLAVVTAGYTPIVPSIVLATCTASGTNDATIISAGTMALTEDQAGTVQGAATRIISDAPANVVWSASHSWITTGVPTGAATVFTCTIGGTGLVAADVDEIELITVWFPT